VFHDHFISCTRSDYTRFVYTYHIYQSMEKVYATYCANTARSVSRIFGWL